MLATRLALPPSAEDHRAGQLIERALECFARVRLARIAVGLLKQDIAQVAAAVTEGESRTK